MHASPFDIASDGPTLVDQLLAEQRRLTAVERFSHWHDRHEPGRPGGGYRDLIPLSAPAPGQQYAFSVDLDACTGCKACVSACHSLNGLDEHETWRHVGTLQGGTASHPVQQTVTTACHHCVEPGCLEGCPVGAYEKQADTGIVRHLDDQCIGCQYCVLKCPYDVPQYHEKLGIVRKCDMCHSRLAAGEAPACVQACPTEAIRITLVTTEELRHNTRDTDALVPGAFSSSYTYPTTEYRHLKSTPLLPADGGRLAPEHAHPPLTAMLVLTQAGVGLLASSLFAAAASALVLALAAAAVFHAGLAASVLHLGRPLGAWRFFLGLRTSWLSREILAFGLASPLFLGSPIVGLLWPAWFPAVAFLGTAAGLLAVFCSIMVYVDTRRAFWNFPRVAIRFAGTAIVLGAAGAAAVSGDPRTAAVALAFGLAKGLAEILDLAVALRQPHPLGLAARSARIHLGPLRILTVGRFACLLAGRLIITSSPPVALAVLTIGELLERHLFFRGAAAPRMPGNA